MQAFGVQLVLFRSAICGGNRNVLPFAIACPVVVLYIYRFSTSKSVVLLLPLLFVRF